MAGGEFAFVSDENFSSVLQEHRKVLVFFTGSICGQCFLAEKNLKETEKNFPDVFFCEAPVEHNASAIKAYAVQSVPQIRFFIDGEVVWSAFGIRTADDLYYNLSAFRER